MGKVARLRGSVVDFRVVDTVAVCNWFRELKKITFKKQDGVALLVADPPQWNFTHYFGYIYLK